MTELEIQDFWNSHPCGESLVSATDGQQRDLDEFFRRYDEYRYRTERHIPACLDRIDFENKRVLEVGLGQGADAEQIIRRGAHWTGLDLTAAAVERVKARLSLRGLPHSAIHQGSVLRMPFDAHSFDVVYSHGVLHHVPEIEAAQREIHRVLRPGGELIVMLYAKWSLNYVVSIALLRRLGLLALYWTRQNADGVYGQHLANARAAGLSRYLRLKQFVHRNTDGPLNPYSKVYDKATIRRDFPLFKVTRSYRRYMHAPPLPVHGVPLGRILGWHLWVHLRPV